MDVITLLAAYFASVNFIGFALMGIDKHKAKKRAFRIPEATLFIVAVIGGSAGSLLGMYLFRHKTRHRSFVIGMPLILFLQIALVFAVLKAPVSISVLEPAGNKHPDLYFRFHGPPGLPERVCIPAVCTL